MEFERNAPKKELNELISYGYSINEEILNIILDDDYQSFPFRNYDDKTNILKFGAVFFSENYLEIIPPLVFFQSLERYVDAYYKSFLIIYNHFWGDDNVMAFAEITNNKFSISEISKRSDIENEIIEEAEKDLESVMMNQN